MPVGDKRYAEDGKLAKRFGQSKETSMTSMAGVDLGARLADRVEGVLPLEAAISRNRALNI